MSKTKTGQKPAEGKPDDPGRDRLLHFWVSQKELEMIKAKKSRRASSA